jgi:hypothetical protein
MGLARTDCVNRTTRLLHGPAAAGTGGGRAEWAAAAMAAWMRLRRVPWAMVGLRLTMDEMQTPADGCDGDGMGGWSGAALSRSHTHARRVGKSASV